MNDKAYLVLQNGTIFEGTRFGARGDVTAELVFTTGMTGYLETLTDPSYHGQIVLQTFPHIGNYGVIPADFESKAPALTAYVVHELCAVPSNFRSEGPLGPWLEKQGVVGLAGIDTRAVTRQLRECGVMNASILSEPPADLEAYCASLAQKKLGSDVYAVTGGAPAVLNPSGEKRVVLWDFGAKAAMGEKLAARGCEVVSLPATADAKALLALHPDGVLLSNGPGDPAAYAEIIQNVAQVAQSGVPMFGICLGHQLLALARGAKSGKLKYGHRGANQPVRETATGKLYITSQNHGYAIEPETLPPAARMSYENLNDGTCEGVDYTDIPAFSVQFHPEACAGPLDTDFLFDRFVAML